MKIELYISRELCDIGDPNKFSVYLKKQLYNPAELSLKDAQASYSITLPATNTNNRIFGYLNVEEVQGKFERLYDAELVVNGIRIFEGKFKLSEINSVQYKGNLGVPTQKTIKEIFGEKNMNELGEWKLDLTKYGTGLDFVSAINKEKQPDCIFPYVLYGLMARDTSSPMLYEAAKQNAMFKKEYLAKYKTIYDKEVRLGIEDIPASVNCLRMLDKIFSEQGYKLMGTAFDDQNLQNLYVSYRNPNDYAQGWNWGDLSEIKISGKWKTAHQLENKEYSLYERQITTTTDDYGKYYNVNLFNCNNVEITEIKDSGTNVMYSEYADSYNDKDKNKYKRKSLHVIIPKSGYYKVRLKCDKFRLESDFVRFYHKDDETNLEFTQLYHRYQRHNDFRRSRYEVQLMRDYGTGNFKNTNIVGVFNKPQFPQRSMSDQDQTPKYYPYANGPMVIDPCVNENFISGLRWGSNYGNGEWNGKDDKSDGEGSDKLVSATPNYMFIANGFSWDKTFEQKNKILSTYDSSVYIDGERQASNYYKWGILGLTETVVNEETGQDEQVIVSDIEGDSQEYNPNFDPDDDSDDDGKDLKEETGWLDVLDKEIGIQQRYAIFKDYPAQDKNGKYLPANYVKNGGDNGDYFYAGGSGSVESIIWLERGEQLAVCFAGDLGDKNGGGKPSKLWDECVVMVKELEFSLHVEPFRSDIEWNNFDSKGNYSDKSPLGWDDDKETDAETGKQVHIADKSFRKGMINLFDFLPSNIKADGWIENFCKAFNLSLVRVDDESFELNKNNSNISSDSARLIDVDQRAHIVHRTNQSLNLPPEYKLGFSNNDDEEGYYRSQKAHDADEMVLPETGDGSIVTGSVEYVTPLEQRSNFSYCWYKQLYQAGKPDDKGVYKKDDIKEFITVPIISKHEVWDVAGKSDYKSMLSKVYFDSTQRFWYKNGVKNLPFGMQSPQEESDKPASNTSNVNTFADEEEEDSIFPQKYVDVALVKDNYEGGDGLILTYEDKPNSISRNYFFVPDAGSAYTEIECVLTPDEYNRLNVSLIRFNGSLYHAISIDGYDPTCRKPAKLKIIPKMN